MMELNSIFEGDALSFLRSLPDESIHCAITSPPYYALRVYKTEGYQWEAVGYSPMAGVDPITVPEWSGELGLEPTIEMYIGHLVLIFRELRRVLRGDGVFWLNIADSFAGGGNYRGVHSLDTLSKKQRSNRGAQGLHQELGANVPDGLKPKDLIMIPARIALACQADGWWLRSDAPWIKVNAMPSSQSDRFTVGHEHLFQFAKSASYYFDGDAIKKPYTEPMNRWGGETLKPNGKSEWDEDTGAETYRERSMRPDPDGRAYRTSDVYMDAIREQITWLESLLERGGVVQDNLLMAVNTPTEGTNLAHFASFPQALVKPMIEASCPETVCAVCGAPHIRVTENTSMKIRRSNWGALSGNRTASSGTMLSPAIHKTIGFVPTCDCNGETQAGTVIDPFFGTGTVGAAARNLKRNWLGSEINSEYVIIAKNRLRQPFEPIIETVKDVPLSPLEQFMNGVD